MSNKTKKEAAQSGANTLAASLDQKNVLEKSVTKKNGKVKHNLAIDSTVRTLSVKMYLEHIPGGFDAFMNAVRSVDQKEFQIIAILHDKDLNTDDFWAPTILKPHIHVIIRSMDGTFRVKFMLEMLGIVFRPGIDDELLKNHGLETVGRFSNMACYLTHETEDCDGKYVYDKKDLISNLSPEGIQMVRDGYFRIFNKRKLTPEDVKEYGDQAFKLGYEFKSYTYWLRNNLPQSVQLSNTVKYFAARYKEGLDAGVKEDRKINRAVIFIQGPPNCGKTHAVGYAAKKLGLQMYNASVGGTGQFDDLTIEDDILRIDDMDITSNILQLTDNVVTRLHRRGSSNPYFAGRYVVITSNHSFEKFLKTCRVDTDDEERFTAISSRFFVCKIREDDGIPYADVLKLSLRGNAKDQQERCKLFEDFMVHFNDSLYEYRKMEPEVSSYDVPDIETLRSRIRRYHGNENNDPVIEAGFKYGSFLFDDDDDFESEMEEFL